MALPFLSNQMKRRDQIIAIDLGARTTKAVHVQRKGETYSLLKYALLDAPIYEKNLSAELLGEHLKSIAQSLAARSKQVTLVAGVNDSLLRHAELPMAPIPDMRMRSEERRVGKECRL